MKRATKFNLGFKLRKSEVIFSRAGELVVSHCAKFEKRWHQGFEEGDAPALEFAIPDGEFPIGVGMLKRESVQQLRDTLTAWLDFTKPKRGK